MRRQLLLLLTLLALFLLPPTTGLAARSAAHTKKQAEVNVLRAVPGRWRARRLRGLVDARTHLLADNTEAICHGRGRRRAGNRFPRFVCVVRPHVHARGQGLYVGYRALSRGRFTLRWIAYRGH
jgi:hypothetical protein